MAGGDLTAYIDFDTTKAKRGLDDLEAKNHRTTSTIEKEWGKAGETIAKAFGPGNLLRAGFAGVAASIAMMSAGMREYAKYSEQAAKYSTQLAESRSKFFADIGGDIMYTLDQQGLPNQWELARVGRELLSATAVEMFSLGGNPLTSPRDAAVKALSSIGARDMEYAQKTIREYAAKTLDLNYANDVYRLGPNEAAIRQAQRDLSGAQMSRMELSTDDPAYQAKRDFYLAQEMASMERINVLERERREEAERRTEAEQKAADLIAREQTTRMMASERAKDTFAFQYREIAIANAKARGEDVSQDEINLAFDRMNYGIASDASVSPEDRDLRRSQLDALRAERLASLGMMPEEEAITARRSFARPGSIGGGFAGVTSIYRQAFAPPGAGGPDVEVQQLKELQQIRKSVQGGQVARLG